MDVLLIESENLYSHGLICLIESLSEDISVKSCPSIEDSFSCIDDCTYDILLLSSRNEVEACHVGISRLIDTAPELPVVLVPVANNLEHLQQALHLGVKGIISSISCHKELLAVFRLVAAGGIYIPRDFISEENVFNISSTSAPVQCISTADTNADFVKLSLLSDRQIQVLNFLVQGKPNKAISDALCISENTVKTHLSAIFRLLGVRNRNEAVYIANQAQVPLDRVQITNRVSSF